MEVDAPMTPHAQSQLIVIAGGRRHALQADRVLEVTRRPNVTRVPHGPPALVGVFYLRGAVLPLISLARLLNAESGAEQHVVVLDHGGRIGVLVDAVPRLEAENQGTEARPLDLVTLLDVGFKRPVRIGSTLKRPEITNEGPTEHENKRVLVSFQINAQAFALPLTAVIEILRLPSEVALVARADQAVMGVINLRNRSLPVISLAALLGFPDAKAERSNRPVLVVHYNDSRVGLVADSVASVLRLEESSIDKVPAVLQRGSGEAELDAIGRPSSRSLVSILSVPKLFANSSVKGAISSETREDNSMVEDQSAADQREKYLIFDLGDERYGLSVEAVDEVLRLPDLITRLPNGPRFVSGIINLRGRPVPLIDQRQRFDVSSVEVAARPRVIIVTVGSLQAGLVVDAASEIISVTSDDLVAAPHLSSKHTALFKQVTNFDDADGRLILIVDPEELLTRAEQDAIAEFTKQQTHTGAQ